MFEWFTTFNLDFTAGMLIGMLIVYFVLSREHKKLTKATMLREIVKEGYGPLYNSVNGRDFAIRIARRMYSIPDSEAKDLCDQIAQEE
jgi:hypothetical protein